MANTENSGNSWSLLSIGIEATIDDISDRLEQKCTNTGPTDSSSLDLELIDSRTFKSPSSIQLWQKSVQCFYDCLI